MGSKSSSAPPPDPRLIEGQLRSMGIQDAAIQQMMDNSKAMLPMQREQLQFGLDTSRTAYNQSLEDRVYALGQRNKLTGMQNQMADQAASFNTEDKRNELAGQAMADVNQGYSSAREQSARGMARMGVNPNSGRALAMNNQMDMAQAASLAGASNMARTAARAEGYKLQDRASNALSGFPQMGMALTGQAAGFGASGLGMANSGLAGMNGGFSMSSQAAGGMGQNATGMYNAMGNYKNNQDQIAASNDPFNTILGAAAGAGMSKLMSDRRAKTDIRRVGQTDNGVPIYTYRYKMGGPVLMGVMADEVKTLAPSAYCEAAAPGGYDAVDYSKVS